MFRPLMLLTLAAFLVSSLTGCIVIDDHWWWGGHGGHGGHMPPGQYKKHH